MGLFLLALVYIGDLQLVHPAPWVNIRPNARGGGCKISFFWQIQQDKDFMGAKRPEKLPFLHVFWTKST